MKFGYTVLPFWLIIAASLTGHLLGLGLGVTRIYRYDTEVIAGDGWTNKQTNKDIGYRISADAHVTKVWENVAEKTELVKMQFENLEILRVGKEKTKVSHSSKAPLFVEKAGNEITKVYVTTKLDPHLTSLLKGLATILHYRTESTRVMEKDVSGICDTAYIVTGNKIEKVKERCKNSESSANRGNKLRLASVNFVSRTEYDLEQNHELQEAVVDERAELASNIWKDGKVAIRAKTKLQKKDQIVSKEAILPIGNLKNILEDLKKHYKTEFLEDTIVVDPLPIKPLQANNLSQLAKNYQKRLQTENLAKLGSASAFLKLLKYFKNCPEAEVETILENKKLQLIVPQILDLMAFGGTSTTADAVFRTLQKKGHPDLMERFLLSLSLVSRPTEDLLQVMLNLLNDEKLNDKLKASVIATLGALLKTMNSNSVTWNNKVFQTAVDSLEKNVKDCKTNACSSMYLRGLRNAALDSSKSMLIEVALKGGRPAFEALLALKNIGFSANPSECEAFCSKILYSPKLQQESSTKAVAAEILLGCSVSSIGPLKRLLIIVGREKTTEFGAFIASKLAREMEQNKELRLKVFSLFSDKDVADYFSLYHGSSSVSFVKPLISVGPLNSTYSIDMEMLPGGLLKRSSFDIGIQGKDDNLQLITVGIFADGMSSFVGDSGSEGKDESPRAGLELSVMGVSLRPYVFFESTSELMSHVWSGTASEPTPALQGNFLVTDHSEVVVLQNGLNARLFLQGVLSVDLSGAIQISIWSRNSNSQVQNGAAFLMAGSIGVDAFDSTVEDEIIYRGETTLDFITKFDFYEEPYKMCLQMVQPEFKFLVDRRKSAKLAGGKFMSKKILKSKFLVPAKSYPIHKKNDELCSLMLSEG